MPQDPNAPPANTQIPQPISPQPATPPQPIAPQNPTPIQTPTPPTATEPVIIHPQSETITPQPMQQTIQPPPPSSLYPKSTKKIFLISILIFFFLTVATFGGALTLAYNNYPLFTPPKIVTDTLDNIIAISPLPKPTRLIIESTIAKTTAIKSADYKSVWTISTNSENSPIESIKITSNGPAEFDKQKIKASEFDLGLEVNMEGATLNGDASVKLFEDRYYFKINEIPFGQMYQQLLDYKDKWYYLDIPDELKPREEDEAISQNVNKLIAEFVKKSANWTTITSKEGSIYEMEITPPKDELVNLLYDIIQSVEPKYQDKLSNDLSKEKLSEVFTVFKDLKISIKVHKDSYLLKESTIQFNIELDDFPQAFGTENTLPQSKMIINFNLTSEISNYNKQVVIIPPSDAINIETAIAEITSSLAPSLQLETALPEPERIPTEEELAPEATEEGGLENGDLHSLISPEETILGEKYNWEKELARLLSLILR